MTAAAGTDDGSRGSTTRVRPPCSRVRVEVELFTEPSSKVRKTLVDEVERFAAFLGARQNCPSPRERQPRDAPAVRWDAPCIRFAWEASTKEVAPCGYGSPRSRAGTRRSSTSS